MRLIDADALMEKYNLKDATKYGNRDVEQQNHSYSTMMLYEVADMIDDAPTIEAVPVHGNKMQYFNDDLIRRTDALNMVHNFFLAKIKTVSGDREEIPMGELDPFLNDNKELSAKIKSIPNFEDAPVVHGWIPCSERLPDTGTEVLVTLGYTYESDYTMYSIARYIRFDDDECHWCDNRYGYLEWDKYSDGRGGNSSYKVIAWMPLPKLYSAKMDGKAV